MFAIRSAIRRCSPSRPKSLDHASGGRFELGIGLGSIPAELETFGVSTAGGAERTTRLSETLAILWRPVERRAVRLRRRALHPDGRDAAAGADPQDPDHHRWVGPRTSALVRDYADWWNVAISALDRIDDSATRSATSASIQRTVAVVPSEAERAVIVETTRRRWEEP